MKNNYTPNKTTAIDDLTKWYETNGKTNVKKEESTTEVLNKRIDNGNFDGISPIMQIAYGLEKIQKTKEAEQAAKNEEFISKTEYDEAVRKSEEMKAELAKLKGGE